MLKKKDKNGLQLLKINMPLNKSIAPHTVIKEMEALLIKAMDLKNRADSKFIAAEEWTQVALVQQDKLLARLR